MSEIDTKLLSVNRLWTTVKIRRRPLADNVKHSPEMVDQTHQEKALELISD
jgi:hypothetical protein